MRSILTSALIAAATVAFSLTAEAHGYGDGMGGDGWNWGFGHMAFGGLMMLLFWGGIFVLIVLAVRWIGGGSAAHSGTQTSRKSPREILEERFARSEIDKDEFEERKRRLSD